MSMVTRRDFYPKVELDGRTKELDYLDTKLLDMTLPTRTTFRIPISMVDRVDLISLKFFGNYHMGWLISLHNGILDPLTEYHLGRNINIPELDEYYRFYNNNASGE